MASPAPISSAHVGAAACDHAAADRTRSDRLMAVSGLAAACLPLEALEDDWRRLETTGLATPYQRFDWVRAYATHALTASEGQLACVRIATGDGKAVAILPLVVKRRTGLTVAHLLGGKHANFHMGVFDRNAAARLDPDTTRALLRQAASAIGGVDVFMIQNQPVRWDGVSNPLAAVEAHPSPSQAYRLALQANADAALAASMSSHARKKHKNKRARFAEMGQSRFIVAEDPAMVERILETFLRQKALRFAGMGVPDPFQDAGVRAFLREGANTGANINAKIGASDAPLLLAGLELNGRLIATYVGARHGERFSGMATSFEPDPAVIKVSPGEILLIDLIRWACGQGYRSFDLGVGEARYKTTICNETEELVDSFIAITAKGRLLAQTTRLQRLAKGWIKRQPVALALARRAMRPKPTQQDA
jgi:CelD/BcsL family acetyltransferase involved in cellulose biosynthesis